MRVNIKYRNPQLHIGLVIIEEVPDLPFLGGKITTDGVSEAGVLCVHHFKCLNPQDTHTALCNI